MELQANWGNQSVDGYFQELIAGSQTLFVCFFLEFFFFFSIYFY